MYYMFNYVLYSLSSSTYFNCPQVPPSRALRPAGGPQIFPGPWRSTHERRHHGGCHGHVVGHRRVPEALRGEPIFASGGAVVATAHFKTTEFWAKRHEHWKIFEQMCHETSLYDSFFFNINDH